jgi:hypothetical protein
LQLLNDSKLALTPCENAEIVSKIDSTSLLRLIPTLGSLENAHPVPSLGERIAPMTELLPSAVSFAGLTNVGGTNSQEFDSLNRIPCPCSV